jgi:hypothetical protein
VFNGLLDPEHTLYSDKALSTYVTSHNKRYSSTENTYAVHEMPLHDVKVRVSYTTSSQRTTRSVLSDEPTNYAPYIRLIPILSFDQINQQIHTATNS